MRTWLATVALLLAIAARAVAAESVSLPGGPLSVSVGPLGQCQSSYAGAGNDFYPPTGTLGDCGFFIGFPEAGNPAFLQKKVFGFEGAQGPALSSQYTPISQDPPTGTGSPSDPYRQLTVFKVSDPAKVKEGDYALVRETTSYVDGEAEFTSTFDVENVTGQSVAGLSPAAATSLRFHAIYAGDLMTAGSDFGTGTLLPGPPRFVGGQDEAAGALGGFVEALPPSPPWTNYATGCWNVVPEPEARCPTTSPSDVGVWTAVRGGSGEGPVFNDDIDPNAIDDAVGVSWDNHLNTALQPGERATYSIANRAAIPAGLAVAPPTQTLTVGQTATVTVTATDNAGRPYAERPIVYTIGETNPKAGSVLTNPAGVATISYVGTVVGPDTLQLFLDLAGSGARVARDPAAAAQVTWAAAPPTASSRFALRSVHAATDGTVTVVLVPEQEGTATAEVTVPTATVAGAGANLARSHGCRRGEIRLKGRCRPKTTVSGRLVASGRAGVALSLVVKPSRAVRRAVAKGRAVRLTAKVGYSSRLGGKATVERFVLTVKRKPAAGRRRTKQRH